MRHLYHILALPAIALALIIPLAGCSNTECSDNRNSLPLAGFMSSSQTPQTIVLEKLSITGLGAPKDSVLSVSNASQAYLPFSIEANTTAFELSYDDTPYAVADTLTFTYDISPWFGSSDCGVIYRYKIKDITHTTHLIDSVTCPAGVIDNTPGCNIFIYFRMSDAPVADSAQNPVKTIK